MLDPLYSQVQRYVTTVPVHVAPKRIIRGVLFFNNFEPILVKMDANLALFSKLVTSHSIYLDLPALQLIFPRQILAPPTNMERDAHAYFHNAVDLFAGPVQS